MKNFQLSLAIGFVMAIIITVTCFGEKNAVNLRENVLRVHILANSDSEKDQQLKLKVRDRVLKETENLFYNVDTKEKAEKITQENIDEIIKIAQDEIRKNGYDYPVAAEIKDTFFDTRMYGDVTLPAGRYDALRILIGEGKGQNWWCVMFPQLCIPSSKEKTFTEDEMKIVSSPKYKPQFAAVELFQKAKKVITAKGTNS
ncbi:MAG: stage II sporulation protein R [Oscillospiraceae bacterium]